MVTTFILSSWLTALLLTHPVVTVSKNKNEIIIKKELIENYKDILKLFSDINQKYLINPVTYNYQLSYLFQALYEAHAVFWHL